MAEVLEHASYVADDRRLAAYDAALSQVVDSTTSVLDLGSGTGVLGVLAAKAGAARVYSVDRGVIIDLARAVALANGFGQNSFIRGYSTEIGLPERVDVAVCDQMGPFGFDAGILRSFHDAATRHVKPGGRLVPHRLDISLVPVSVPDLRDTLDLWHRRPGGIDFTPAFGWAVNQVYDGSIAPGQLLGSVCAGASLELATFGPRPFVMSGTSVIESRGAVDAIAGAWVAELVPGLTISNAPWRTDQIIRPQAALPLTRALRVEPGDEIDIRIHVNPVSANIAWWVKLRPKSGAELVGEQHSTLLGRIVSRDTLDRSRPDAVPMLGPRSRAQLGVLQHASEGRSIAEIEDTATEQHPDALPTLEDARRFVREVLEDAQR